MKTMGVAFVAFARSICCCSASLIDFEATGVVVIVRPLSSTLDRDLTRSSGPDGSARGREEPVIQPGLAATRPLCGHERALRDGDPVVTGGRVRHDLARVTRRAQHPADRLPEPEDLRPADLDDTIRGLRAGN